MCGSRFHTVDTSQQLAVTLLLAGPLSRPAETTPSLMRLNMIP